MESLIEKLSLREGAHWRVELVNEHKDVSFGAAARIKDPLFAVGRQWQLNRFRAFNGGSIVSAVVYNAKSKLQTVIEGDSPLEFQINEGENEYKKERIAHLPETWDKKSFRYHGTVVNEEKSTEFAFHDLTGEGFDWYNFQIIKRNFGKKVDDAENRTPRKFTYKGQPERRWWAFEDGRVNLNAVIRPYVNPVTMLMVGALQSSNSYSTYIIPLLIKPGEVVHISDVILYDSFGNKQKYVEASQTFSHSVAKGIDDANNVFYFPDSMIDRALSSEILEEVQFNTDHFSNVIWAIEKRCLDDQGFPKNIDERTESDEQLVKRIAEEKAESIKPEVPAKKLIENIKTTAFYKDGDGEDAKMIHFPTGKKPAEGLSDPYYVEQLQVLSRVPRNAFPLIKQKAKGSGDTELRLGKISTYSEYRTNLLKKLDVVDSSYLPEYPSRLVRRYYLAFDSNKKPYLWIGIQHRLSERAFPIPVLFDQLM